MKQSKWIGLRSLHHTIFRQRKKGNRESSSGVLRKARVSQYMEKQQWNPSGLSRARDECAEE